MSIARNILYVMGATLLVIWLGYRITYSPSYVDYFISNTNELKNLTEIPSPNRVIIVETFNIYGGATSTDVTQVLIRLRSERFDSRSNFCLLSIEGLKKTKITWINDARLDIQYEPGMLYKAATEWHGINVTYSELK